MPASRKGPEQLEQSVYQRVLGVGEGCFKVAGRRCERSVRHPPYWRCAE
ncbi:hypothetical protein ITJ43_11370 [Microbacterium sp. VKM Ac-2870]|nr:hypothetical protein [Microbacterium sp. VKM Ac-2870]